MIKPGLFLLCFTVCLLVFVLPCSAATPTEDANKPASQADKAVPQDEKWYISFYAGKSSSTKFIDFFKMQASYEDSYIYVVAGGVQLIKLWDALAIEVEGQIGQHSGMQDHQEINVVLIARLTKLPWNKWVETSFAIGDGLSYATKTPYIELDKEKTSKLLNYLMAEAAVTVYKKPKIETFIRIHHRSGIFGLINDVKSGGSNFLTGGLRYRF
jgi:hypothetical protein